MPHTNQPYRRREPGQQPSGAPPVKMSGITEAHFIRIVSKVGTGIFRDGMTVGEYLRAARSRDVAIRQIASSVQTRSIRIESELTPPEPEGTP